MVDGKHEVATPLDWISVEGFRSIARLERLPLGPINVLIGANGSGKSNLIQVFALLRAWHLGRLDEYVDRTGGGNRNLHFGAKVTTHLPISMLFKNDKTYDIEFKYTVDDRLVLRERCVGPEDERLDQWRVYHFHDTGIGAPLLRNAYLDDNKFLREDGENLSSFLYYLKHKEKRPIGGSNRHSD